MSLSLQQPHILVLVASEAAAPKVARKLFPFLVNEIIGWFLCALARITAGTVKLEITGAIGEH